MVSARSGSRATDVARGSRTHGVPRAVLAPRLRALRGATTVRADEPAEMATAVRELVLALVRANDLVPDDIVSAFWTATPDLRCLYPAAVAREVGWQDVPMLCAAEMDVAGAPPRCVRVLVHVATAGDATLRHVYLHGARVLRPDLAGDA